MNKENDLEMIDVDKQDPDFEEETIANHNNNSDGSILTSDYDDLPPIESDEIEEQIELNEVEAVKNSIHIDYSFNGQDVIEGLTTMQALLNFKKHMIYTGVLFVIFMVYLLDFANFQSFVLGLLCIAAIAMIWIMPRVHIRRFAKAADNNKIKLSMDIYPDSIKVVSGNNPSVTLAFNGQIQNIIETDNLFIICSGKERVFIVPKRCIDENILEFVREIFELAMGDNYFSKKSIVI